MNITDIPSAAESPLTDGPTSTDTPVSPSVYSTGSYAGLGPTEKGRTEPESGGSLGPGLSRCEEQSRLPPDSYPHPTEAKRALVSSRSGRCPPGARSQNLISSPGVPVSPVVWWDKKCLRSFSQVPSTEDLHPWGLPELGCLLLQEALHHAWVYANKTPRWGLHAC